MDADPSELARRLGLRLTEVARLHRHWARKLAEDPALADETFTRSSDPALQGQNNDPVRFTDKDTPGTIISKLGSNGTYYVFGQATANGDLAPTAIVIADHSNDPRTPNHMHAGTIPVDDTRGTYGETPNPTGGDNHIYYK